jgi:hypothetical protein
MESFSLGRLRSAFVRSALKRIASVNDGLVRLASAGSVSIEEVFGCSEKKMHLIDRQNQNIKNRCLLMLLFL